MLPPFTPFHLGMYRGGKHYTQGRFFPTVFLEAALGALATAGTCIADATSMDAATLCAKVLAMTGVDYDAIWTKENARYAESHALFANYDVADFSMAVPEEVKVAVAGAGAQPQAVDALGATGPVPLAPLLASAAGTAAEASAEGGDAAAAPSQKDIDDGDKMALQSYGRWVG